MEPPKQLAGDAAAAGRHYDNIVEAERARLEQFCPVEYAITLRYLDRFTPQRCHAAEIGVGTGHYSEFLARRGCRIELVDVSANLLEADEQRLSAAGLDGYVDQAHHASATDLPLADASKDFILLLGPLYHLRDLSERRKAVAEACRVLKPGGIVAAAGINRITFLRDMFRAPDPYSETFFGPQFASAQHGLQTDPEAQGFMARYLATGALDPEHAPPIGYAHLTTIAEFRELLTARFEELVLIGTESFTAPWQDQWKAKSDAEKAAWLEIVEATGKIAEGMAYSDHFLFIGRRATMPTP